MHPILLHFGPVSIPTFGLLAAAGLLAALFLSLRTAPPCGLLPEKLWNAGLFAVVAAFLSSRLLLIVSNLHSFSEAPMLLLTLPSLTAGGLLLTMIATIFYLQLRRLPLLRVLDAWAAPGLLLWAALALGHLAEGSDPGLPAARFGLKTSLAGYREQPVALYVAVVALLLAAVLFRRTQLLHRAGHVAALGLLLGGTAQFVLSFARLPFLYTGPTPLRILDPIQWVALLLVVLGCVTAVASAMQNPARAGGASPEPELQLAFHSLRASDELAEER